MSIFHPPLTGNEKFDSDGSYEASEPNHAIAGTARLTDKKSELVWELEAIGQPVAQTANPTKAGSGIRLDTVGDDPTTVRLSLTMDGETQVFNERWDNWVCQSDL